MKREIIRAHNNLENALKKVKRVHKEFVKGNLPNTFTSVLDFINTSIELLGNILYGSSFSNRIVHDNGFVCVLILIKIEWFKTISTALTQLC